MPEWLWPIVAILLGYVLGSIPFGVIMTRLGGAGNLREIGSGNIGATNVLRTGRKGLAAATLLLDLAKGTAAVIAAGAIDPSLAIVGGFGAFFGHLFPVWLKFQGGKGVATLLGVCLGLGWPLALVYALVWLGGLALTRISSVSGMAASISAPLAAFALGDVRTSLALLVLSIAVVAKHRENIERLMAGTEPKVGQGKRDS
jgi:acyl phosphate:glycerol-3-phosphate acyltransferase